VGEGVVQGGWGGSQEIFRRENLGQKIKDLERRKIKKERTGVLEPIG